MTTWTAVLLTAAGCYGLKAAGWAVPSRWLETPAVRGAVTLLPVALLAALVVVQGFGSGRGLTVDARAAALAAGALCLWRRAPFAVVLVVSAAAAALVRAV
jgi:hypothetical protein